jgi:acetylglutamate kinase
MAPPSASWREASGPRSAAATRDIGSRSLRRASALDAAKNGVNTVHIIDGRVPHAMLLEVLTEQAYGTMIRSH